MPRDPATRRECLEFELRLDAAVSDETREHEWGRSFLTPSLPLLWDASWIAVEEPRLGFVEIAALADEVLGGAGIAHRTAVICDEDAGARIAAEAEAEPGWQVERVHYMALRGEPGRTARTTVGEPGMEEIADLRRELMGELVADDRDAARAGETVEQGLALAARYAKFARDRWYAAPADEEPESACHLLQDGGIGQVEDVATVAPARGQGLAQAVVLAAAAASRADGDRLTFLSADATGWPRLMYAKLGFEMVGELHVVRRPPP